jgi:hypothetical protein
MYQVRVRDGIVRYSAYATKEDAQKYLVKRVCNLKGLKSSPRMERIREETHQDVIVDVYACDIITDEFSVQETLLIPQSKEWFENARDLLQNNFFNHKQSLTLITKYLL